MLSAVTRQMCLQYINAYLQKMGNSDRTRYNKYGRLRGLLTHAGAAALLTDKDKPRYSSEDPVCLEVDELEKFWQVCPNHKRLLYTIFLMCGFRVKELQTLRWVDIDFVKGKILVHPRPEYRFKPKKHHCRSVPVNDGLLAELRSAKTLAKYPLVFQTKKGGRLTHLWEDTNKLFAKAKLPLEKGHPHCFRATFCTTLFRSKEWDLPSIMRVMGHLNSDTTLRYMVPLRDDDLRKRMVEVKFAVATMNVA